MWDSFWDNPELSFDDRQLFIELREKANEELAQIEDQLDYGLIHADLVHTNVLIEGDVTKLIDFDDGGYGFRIFDIATTLLKNQDEDNYHSLKASLISGYTSVRLINLAHLDLFIVLRSATYVGWNITRINEDGGAMRNAKFINRKRRLAQDFLSTI